MEGNRFDESDFLYRLVRLQNAGVGLRYLSFGKKNIGSMMSVPAEAFKPMRFQ